MDIPHYTAVTVSVNLVYTLYHCLLHLFFNLEGSLLFAITLYYLLFINYLLTFFSFFFFLKSNFKDQKQTPGTSLICNVFKGGVLKVFQCV